MSNPVVLGVEYFPNPSVGRPVFNGFIYVGDPDQNPISFPKTVTGRRQDNTDVTLTQPIRTNAGGVPVEDLTSGNVVTLFVDGNYSLLVQDSSQTQLYFVTNAFDAPASVGVFGNLRLSGNQIESTDIGGNVDLKGLNSSSVVTNLAFYDPDGSSLLFHAGIQRFKTDAGGTVVIKSDGNTDTEFRGIDFRQQNETSRAFIAHDSSSLFVIRNAIHGGGLNISGEDNSGNVRTLIQGFPTGTVDLFHSSSSDFVLRTQDRSASGSASGCLVRGPEGAERFIGFNTIPQFTRNVDYTFSRLDIGKVMVHNETTNRNWNLNNDATIPVGSTWLVHNLNTGNVNFISGAGVTLVHLEGGSWLSTTGNLTMDQGAITVYKETDTMYRLWGAGIL